MWQGVDVPRGFHQKRLLHWSVLNRSKEAFHVISVACKRYALKIESHSRALDSEGNKPEIYILLLPFQLVVGFFKLPDPLPQGELRGHPLSFQLVVCLEGKQVKGRVCASRKCLPCTVKAITLLPP